MPSQKLTYKELEARVKKLEKADAAHKENEKKYWKLLQNIQAAVVVHDSTTRIVNSNNRAQEMLGLSEDQMLGKTAIDPDWHFFREDGSVLPPEEYPVNKVLSTMKPLKDCELGIHRPGKREAVWVLVSADPIFDGQGNILEVIVTFVDITERKQAEQKLEASEVFLNRIIDQSPFPTWIADAQGTLVRANLAVKKFLNVTDEQIVGKYNVLEDPIIEREGLMPLIRTVFEKGKTVNFILNWDGRDIPHLNLEGSNQVIIEATMFPIHNARGELTNAVVQWLEVSEQQRTQKELAATKRMLETAIAQSPSGILIADAPDGRIRIGNKAAIDIRGGDSSLLTEIAISEHAKNWKAFTVDGKPYPSEQLPLSRAVLKGEVTQEEELIVRDVHGNDHWISANAAPIRDEQENITAGIVIFNEITDRKISEEKIRESEARYRGLIETTSDLIWEQNSLGVFTYVSPRIEAMLGYKPEELLGKTPFDFMPPDEALRTSQIFKKTVENRQPLEIVEHVTVHKDGHFIVLETNGVPIMDSSGKLCGYRGVSRNISERKRAEEKLKKSEERYRGFVESSLQAIWCFKIDPPLPLDLHVDEQVEWVFQHFVLEECNDVYARMYGFNSASELIGQKNIIDLVGWDAEFIREFIRTLIDSNYAFSGESHEVTNTGLDVWILNNCFGVVEQNNLVRVWGSQIDISEQKRAEALLRESEQSLNSIVENIPDIIYRIDLEGKILFISDAVEKYGYTVEELLGTNIFELIHPEDHEKAQYRINERRAGDRRTKSLEIRLLTKEQVTVPFELKSGVIENTPVFLLDASGMYASNPDGEKKFICTQGIARDITERKRTYDEKEKLENQLRQAQKMESVGRLAGGVAHDFNNMLTVILGNVESAIENVDEADPLHKALKQIEEAGQHSADLTRQLLAFARRQTISPKMLDLNETVANMLAMLRRLIGEDIELIWKPGNNLWNVKIDVSQVDQMMANLCVNARDAIEGNGKIVIETLNAAFDEEDCSERVYLLPGEYVMLSVYDNGCGMDEETKDNVFEPFFTTKDKSKGTGLGLSTVYGIVKQNAGFINIYSEPGHGANFKIYLPRYKDKSNLTEQSIPQEPASRGHETILLVEDEPGILRMAKMMLERLGYRVLAAGTPGEAIAIAEEHSGLIQLLITDVVMPEMNGRELAARLLTLYPDIKRLFMSGYTADVIAHHGVLDEGVNFLQKPFNSKSLAAKIREILDKN